ncbi:hypothetical protein DY000_02017917 [Brassica cretica]|uniref:PPM-type phosphatase domain-containing protein n=1 Tax=Brassica cretica TaxID=69181 RepID=A0ABQ7CX97_BRACR|nr:hypothetical protein DY000_02017917 [Brassica cretica]
MQSTQSYSNIQSQIRGERHTLLRLGRFSKDLGMIGSREPAVTALLINCQKLVVAKYGDSRAVICKDGLAKQLSDYHGPNMEKGVIENRGGFVEMLLEWMANWLWQGHLVIRVWRYI